MNASLERTAMPAQRFAAIEAAEVASGAFDNEFVKRQGLADRVMKFSEDTRFHIVGCFLSHVKALQKAQSQLKPDDLALIMEDDVVVPSNWKYMMQVALADAPANWSLLKVSGWGNSREVDKIESETSIPLIGPRSHVLWDWINQYTGRPGVTYWKLREPFVEWHGENKSVFYAGTGGYIVRGSSIPHVLDHLLHRPIDDLDSMLLSPNGSHTQFYEGWPHVLDLSEAHFVGNNSWHVQAGKTTPTRSVSLAAHAKTDSQVSLHSASKGGHPFPKFVRKEAVSLALEQDGKTFLHSA